MRAACTRVAGAQVSLIKRTSQGEGIKNVKDKPRNEEVKQTQEDIKIKVVPVNECQNNFKKFTESI